MPLPKPGCEPQVLHALLHSGLVTADHPFLLPACEYPHCGAVFADEPFGAMWYWDEDAAETAVYDSRRWAMIKGDDGECHAFCPLHVLHDGDGGRCRSGARYCRPRWRSAAPTRGCRP